MKELVAINITPAEVTVNGRSLMHGYKSLTDVYRATVGDYPKFFKMDGMCKLGFLAAELALRGISAAVKEHAAIIMFSRSGSLATDRNYQKTVAPGDYYPSPAVFVYTLANIVTGEIAIRHKIYGETAVYILDAPEPKLMEGIIRSVADTSSAPLILTGWVDYEDQNDYIANIKLYGTTDTNH